MSNKIIVRPTFQKQAKRLAKRYKSFPNDLQKLVDRLKENAALGTSLGGSVYKIRLAISSKTKAKTAARVLFPTFIKYRKLFICSQFTTKPTPKISLTQS